MLNWAESWPEQSLSILTKESIELPQIGHLVFKTFDKNCYKCMSIKSISAKVKKSKNEQKCAEIDKNARVLSRN